MQIDSKFSLLLNALDEGTRSGRVRWTETADENSFRTTFPHAMVRIGPGEKSALALRTEFVMTLLDEKGKLVDEWRLSGVNEEYRVSPTKNDVQGGEFKRFEELYRRARSSARQSESLIDEILTEVRTASN